MDENDHEIKSPIKRLGSTRKLLIFNSASCSELYTKIAEIGPFELWTIGSGNNLKADIRLQLNEQLRCLDVRMEAQVALVTELQDFFRRRGELELDYSKNLDKLAKSLQLRHKEQKQKREQWPLFSSFACWQQLVSQTRNLSRDHAALSEIYSTHLVSRLSQVMEDVQRIYRRCREIGYETHEEILRVLHELHTTMKTYHSYQSECRQAETKLRLAENQRGKLEQSLPRDKLDRSKKYRLIEKEITKRKNKYTDAKLKALKARNEYILCLEASNTTIHKYFVDDLSDLIDCMDFGFHNCISRALLMHVSAEEGRQRSVQSGMDALTSCIGSLDSRLDKQRFLESNHQAFMIPKKLEFQGQRGDDVTEPELQKVLYQEMETRLCQLRDRVTTLRTESDEVWKTLETAETTLLEMLSAHDYDCTHFFGEIPTSASISGVSSLGPPKPPETLSLKLRADRHETEEFYLTKFREYLLGTTRIARLDAKQEYLRQSLAANGAGIGLDSQMSGNTDLTSKPPARRKRIGRLHISGQPKLFGGSLEEYLESTNQEIPIIVKSCIRVINLYGLHHQGIFRVSGSQVEINNFREWFERGEDPLADMTDASDINSVAGVLKLYLRELREPLFPIIYFEHFMELAQLESKHEFVVKMRELIQSLPRPVIVVMRYLFAFLNHLSEFSDENMMDPYNLAICFGPTLVPVPDDKDQVQYQNQVNELIKNIIMFNDEIFPNDGGCMYEKYISQEPEDNDVEDSPSDHVQDDIDSEVYPSEDESENMEATAQFDFIARSDRELSLKKGDTVTLYTQVSNDWWRGAVNGHDGLIPDKYISLKMKDEDREKLDHLKSSSSEESMRRRASSSNDSVLSEGSAMSSQNHHLAGGGATWPPDNVVLSADAVKAREKMESGTSPRCKRISKSNTIAGATSEHIISHKSLHGTQHLSVPGAVDEDSISVFLEALPAGSTCSPGVIVSGDECSSRSASPVSVELRNPACKTHFKSQSVSEISSEEGNVSFSQNRELWQKRASSQSVKMSTASLVAAAATVPGTDVKSNRHSESWVQRQKHTPDLVMDLPLTGSSSPKETTKKIICTSTQSLSDISSSEEDTASVVSLETVGLPTAALTLGPESPDMSTAAERFAKQNQCTLKKNTKVHVEASEPVALKIDGSLDGGGAGLAPDAPPPTATRSPVPSRVTHKFAAKFADMHLTGSFKPQVMAKPQLMRKPAMSVAHASPEMQRKEK